MSKKIKLDGRPDSNYGKVTTWMRKVGIYTRPQVNEQFKGLGCTETAAVGSTSVMLGPREKSTRGDCRGNASNPWGHQAYNEKLAKVKGQEQKFRFRLRKEELEPRTRTEKIEVSPVKAGKVEVKADAGTVVKV